MHHLDLRGYLFAGIFVFEWSISYLVSYIYNSKKVQVCKLIESKPKSFKFQSTI